MRTPFPPRFGPGHRRVNEQIRLSPVRLIDENGTMLGEVPTDEALRRARDVGQDLVEVDPNSRPPVCKIMDYGKFKYHESKKRHKHHEQKLKEVRLRPKTDAHDREIKVNHAREFLEKGNKVQFTLMFRGRERAHPELAMEMFREIIIELDAIAKVERPPKLEGKRMTMVLMPGHPAPGAKPAANKTATADRASGDGKATSTGGATSAAAKRTVQTAASAAALSAAPADAADTAGAVSEPRT
ncbi:MAG: translation initiation factor IF-3 [Phycisphaerae bacterium]|nr:translation initiation factor IF-3 [Phycisphaerae bacterium]